MTKIRVPPRSAKVSVRLHETEMLKAARLAVWQEVHVPELFRRLLLKAWREATGAVEGGRDAAQDETVRMGAEGPR